MKVTDEFVAGYHRNCESRHLAKDKLRSRVMMVI